MPWLCTIVHIWRNRHRIGRSEGGCTDTRKEGEREEEVKFEGGDEMVNDEEGQARHDQA